MPPVVGKPIGTILTSLSLVVAVCSASWPSPSAAADDAFVRASAGILMSRNMSTKDRVEAADSLARYEPRAAVPILIDALNETSEPVRRAAARGLWTIAQNENPATNYSRWCSDFAFFTRLMNSAR